MTDKELDRINGLKKSIDNAKETIKTIESLGSKYFTIKRAPNSDAVGMYFDNNDPEYYDIIELMKNKLERLKKEYEEA